VNSCNLHKQTFPYVTNDLSYSVHISIDTIYSLDWTEFILNGSDGGVLHLVSLDFWWKAQFQPSKWVIMANTLTGRRRINENQSQLAYEILFNLVVLSLYIMKLLTYYDNPMTTHIPIYHCFIVFWIYVTAYLCPIIL
jgi:hypothetical protein